jgi:hypothetical protein
MSEFVEDDDAEDPAADIAVRLRQLIVDGTLKTSRGRGKHRLHGAYLATIGTTRVEIGCLCDEGLDPVVIFDGYRDGRRVLRCVSGPGAKSVLETARLRAASMRASEFAMSRSGDLDDVRAILDL